MLNKQSGNMYGFVTHTWNPIKGKCPHECSYCYMKKMYKRYKWNPELRLDEKCFKDNLGEGNFIFVGSSTDMFAKEIHTHFIQRVINHCDNSDNKYLFQSKNPLRFQEYCYPNNTILATTIETNRNIYVDNFSSSAPSIHDRVEAMRKINLNKKMITIEPIIVFDLNEMVDIIESIKPIQVNIGADSGHNNLPEPCIEKIQALICLLKQTTTVHLKDNLKRLFPAAL